MLLRLQLPTLALVEVDHAWIGEQAHPLGAHGLQSLQHVDHQLTAQPTALVKRVYGNIPDRGFENTITGATGG